MEELRERLDLVKETLRKAEVYRHAAKVIGYDRETICPPKAIEEEGKLTAFLGSEAFRLTKTEEFINAAEYLYEHREGLGELDLVMAEHLHRVYEKVKNITPEMNYSDSLIRSRAYENWLNEGLRILKDPA